MMRCFIISLCLLGLATPALSQDGDESVLVSNTRQLTFEGLRAGEGYFNDDGTKLIFQSERQADNPWYQIYLMDLETGDINRISPGHGKTSCAWVHPGGKQVLFSSTHDDPKSKQLQQDELDFRASGQERRYSWDYDEHFEIYESDGKGSYYKNLTNARGYDAEGSYSPDGKLIAFASNRHAYTTPLPEEDADLFERDPSYMMDIYIMNSDGSDVKRLTSTLGYDGGPFFSPDGKRITWRRFAPNGATAEIYTMNIDGSDQQQITRVNAMSWAPYYHPSGDYLIFTNNSLGFANFELFIVDTQGKREPVRVTFTDGFDGLPVFHPDGDKIAWTTNRNDKKSQIFLAKWNDTKARELLRIGEFSSKDISYEHAPDAATLSSGIKAHDMKLHIDFLASEQMQGRASGSSGERKAAQYVADTFESMGLEPAGDDGTYFQAFDFIAGVSAGENSTLTFGIEEPSGRQMKRNFPYNNETWRPLAFSLTGEIELKSIAFAGYGIQAPEKEGMAEYDSYVHLDVKDKWVMMFRDMPLDITPEKRQQFAFHSSLRYKAMTARDLGAIGVIFVSGPNSKFKNPLVSMSFDTSLGETSVAAISITPEMAEELLVAHSTNGGDAVTLKELQDNLDSGDVQMGFEIEKVKLQANIQINHETRTSHNVLARLRSKNSTDQALVIGAHLDHLGVGRGTSSLARDDEESDIHYGADDNASGVAGVLEIAQYLAAGKSEGMDMKRDVVFAAWSGEEIGLKGSAHFASTYNGKDKDAPLYPEIAAYLNMDMIGRMKENVILQGVGSSSIWTSEIERRNAPVGLSIKINNTTSIPTDTTSFYPKGVPILNAFTGAHADYHSPRDTADKVNVEGAGDIAKLMGLIARSLVLRDEAPDYIVHEEEKLESRGGLRAYLGTIPDYAEDIKGLKLSGVSKGGPASKGGLQANDIIVELAGRKIENIYDYTYAIEALKIDEAINIVVMRAGERLTLEVTPSSRE